MKRRFMIGKTGHSLIWNSSVWGQIDSVFTLFVFFVWALTERRIPLAAAWWTIAFPINPQAAMFVPLLLFALLRRKNLQTWGKAALYAAVTFPAGAMPFASLNAFNLYALLGLNGARTGQSFGSLSLSGWSDIMMLAVVILLAFLYFRSRDRSFSGCWLALLVCWFLS